MKWILIVFFTTAYKGESPQLAVEFNTADACQVAGETLKARSKKRWGDEPVDFICLPKGEDKP